MEIDNTVSPLDLDRCFAMTRKGTRCGSGHPDGYSPFCGTHAAMRKRGERLELVPEYQFWLWQQEIDAPSFVRNEFAAVEAGNERRAREAVARMDRTKETTP
jgi:hypothetical protein